MITEKIMLLFSSLFQFLMGLLPSFNFIDSLINAKNQFIDFISSFISYTLYLFNIPVLKIAVSILIIYLTFLVGEYIIKLFLKYFVELL